MNASDCTFSGATSEISYCRGNFCYCYCCYSVAKSCPTLCNPVDCSMPGSLSSTISKSLVTSCPLSQWCYLIISSSVTPFSCLQSFPGSRSFSMSQLFASGGQSIGASESVLSMNIQGWFSSGLTGLISLQSKGLLRIFFSATILKHQFFGSQSSLWSNSHIHPYMTSEKAVALFFFFYFYFLWGVLKVFFFPIYFY